MTNKYDFAGWATKYNILCSDGRTIMNSAFKDQHRAKVPLIWGHNHDDPEAVLGYALLEHREGQGIYCYGFFNDTEAGDNARKLVNHGDVDSLSICANKLQQDKSGRVMHGKIREVSLVLGGANEGARIDTVMTHEDGGEDYSVITSGEYLELNHGDFEVPEELLHEEEKGAEEMADNKEKTVQDVIDSMTEEQQQVLFGLLEEALNQAAEKEETKEENEVKHNVFDAEPMGYGTVLTHSDFEIIKGNAKRAGSFRDAYNDYLDELCHNGSADEPTTYTDREGNEINYNRNGDGTPYGIGNVEYMFPDARLVGDRPATIKRDTGWVSEVMSGVKKSPFARIKTLAADITEEAARAKGYIKGNMKKEEFFALMKRTTSPTTIYKKQKMDRDDMIDIVEWDVIAWLKSEMRGMLDEEAARAILVGDGRLADDEDKINEQCIRPIAGDSALYTVNVNINDSGVETTGSKARDFINAVIWNRKQYKGSGNPKLFTTEDMLTECLMLTDEIGRDLYDTEAKLATKLRVSKITTVPAEIFGDTLVGILVNLQDYTVGADKGGQVNMFDDFDIDYNQQKYLIETRMSGALTKPYAAIAFYDTESEGNDAVGD